MLKPKLKHLRHPLRTLNVATKMVSARFEMRDFAKRGNKKFATDPRYELKNVTAGFACRRTGDGDDNAILHRICAAYNATIEHPESARNTYRATGWWQAVRDRSLGPVRQALHMHDTAALHSMYRNFFRDPCCTGLTTVPYGMTDVYFGGKMTDLHRRIYLADTLYRLDYWKQETAGRFDLSDLTIPTIGNPYGAFIEGTLVSARAEFQHCCANRIANLLESKHSTVVEIGGGFGGMAYFLLRDRPEIKYLDFDLPESIALATYYLLKAFPDKNFLLFGEKPLTDEAISNADIVLMPLFEMKRLRAASVDVTFSSHAMTDLEQEELASYLETIFRTTRSHFLFLGSDLLPDLSCPIAKGREAFPHREWRHLHWNTHRQPQSNEVECLYSFNRTDEKKLSAEKDLIYVDR